MKHLYVGMGESDVLDVMKPVSVNWCRLTSGAAGGKQLIFQVSAAQQMRVDIDREGPNQTIGNTNQMVSSPNTNAGPQFVVSRIENPEPKTFWVLDADHNLTN